MTQGWVPPSFAYRTLTSFLTELAERGALPRRFDLGMVAGHPPSVGPQLLDLMEHMGLFDADGVVAPEPMRAVLGGEAERREFLARWARRAYAEQLRLVEAGAGEEELRASMAAFGCKPSRSPQAVRFFRALCADLELVSS